MQYKDWLKEWLEHYVKPSSKQKTYIRYSEIVSQHINNKLGNYEMNELTPLVLQHFTTELLHSGNIRTGKGLSANSVNGIITVIQNSLKEACVMGYIAEYTADKVKRPKIREKQVDCFTPNEQKRIEQAILNGKKTKMFGVVLCLYTGLRIGELLALKWEDVDFQKGIIAVTKTCYDGKDNNGKFTRITDTPKTQTSQRLIPFPKQLILYLKSVRKQNNSGYVVSSGSGKIISVRAYQRSFELLLNKLNITHRGFHSLRHTFATRALECGMDVKTLSEILGHKNATVTLNRYVHSLMEHKKEMMNRLGKLL
ncbi:MAG: site-specific integrase [Lachnospiraceae bacterium]|nr:site-specific integrase [Lachnospiraceae bacterium]